MSKRLDSIITKDLFLEAIDLSRDSMVKFDKLFKKITKKTLLENLGTKMVSEIMSKCLEVTLTTILQKKGYNAHSANASNDSDIKIIFSDGDEDCEIKVTNSNRTWMGGEFSNRPSPHIFVSWGGNFDEFFAILINLDEEGVEWQSNMEKGKTFYAPFINAKQLVGKGKVLIGRFEAGPRGGITVVRENTEQLKMIENIISY